MNDNKYIQFPLAVSPHGNIELSSYDKYIQELIEEFLFTAQGERVNRPTFGAGVERLIFEDLNADILTVLKFNIHSYLQHTLIDRIRVEDLEVLGRDSQLIVIVSYTVFATKSRLKTSFSRAFPI